MARLPAAASSSFGLMIRSTRSFCRSRARGGFGSRNGQTTRLGYDGQNGLPYVPVGRLLVERGHIPREKLTMASIRAWMREHPEAGAALRRENPSYVFFREVKGDGPIGAEKIVLTPARSLAVDRAYIPLGVPIWLDADEQFVPNESVHRLVIAQDTGGAIKGPGARRSVLGHRPRRRRPRRRDERPRPLLPAAAARPC